MLLNHFQCPVQTDILGSRDELLILIFSQFKRAGIGMETIDSEEPDLIIAGLVGKCVCLIFLSFIFEPSTKQAKSRLKKTLSEALRISPLTKPYC